MTRGLILCGGLGSRMFPVTFYKPKAFFTLHGVPLIVNQINLFKKHGINEVILALGNMSDYFIEHLPTGISCGVKLKFSIEEFPLGTGGAIRLALRLLDEKTIIINGDVFADFDLTKLMKHHRKNSKGTMFIKEGLYDCREFGVVSTFGKNKIASFEEKKEESIVGKIKINAGCYMFDKSVIKSIIPEQFSQIENDVLPKLAKAKDLFYVKHDGYWFDIGTTERYSQALEYADKEVDPVF